MKKTFISPVLLLLPALLLAPLGGCSKQRRTEKPRTISVADAYIAGPWKDFLTIEDGKYLLEDTGVQFAADAVISLRLTLIKTYTGELENPAETLRLVPLSPGGSEIDKTFTVSSKEKFNDFVLGQPGTSALITFSASLYSGDTYFKKVAAFDAKTVDPPQKTSAAGGAAENPAPGIAQPVDTRTDPNFTGRTQARIGPRIVAVPELEATVNVPDDYLVGITGAVTSGLMENPGVQRVVDYNQINRIMQQHRFEASDWSNPAKYAEIGRALNVDTIAVGKISDAGKVLLISQEYAVSVQLIDIATMSVVGACTFQAYPTNLRMEAEIVIKKMKVTL